MKYDLIIIGAGPAGLTAALYGLRANKSVLVLEAKSYGGQIINAARIENYPGILNVSGFDFASTLYNQVKSLGCDIKFEKVMSISTDKCVTTSKGSYYGNAIIIATGASNRKLGIDREDELIGKGISYCATCDGNFYRDKTVAVVGGGNTALEDAIYLSDIASKVYLIHRRDSFRGENRYVSTLEDKDNVEFVLDSTIDSVLGEEFISGIRVIDNNGNSRDIDVSGLFIAVGQNPCNSDFSDIIDLDDNGYIISNDGVHTNIDGIYVAGDCRVKDLRQLTTAVGDGANAASAAIKEM